MTLKDLIPGIALILSLGNGLVTLITTWLLWCLSGKNGKISNLETNLQAKAEEVVNVRFTALAAELKSPITMLTQIVQDHKNRLERGDDAFGQQSEQAQQIKLQSVVGIEQVKGWVRENFATRTELDKAVTALQQIEVALASCQAACRHARAKDN